MKEYSCQHRDFLLCGNPIMRESVRDFEDYPICEACQEQEDDYIGRLDNGQHN